MSDSRTLFVRFDVKKWSSEEVDSVLNNLSDCLGDDVNLVATPDEIEFLDEEQRKEMVKSIIDALNETNEQLYL